MMSINIQKSTSTTRTNGVSPFSLVVALFSSVWTGITLATLLFIYCSIGSAIPQFRQHPLLEMTEFQWFHWWPFNVLVVLFCVTMTTVTIRRIPFRLVNAGVLTIHSGMILLTLGSYYYFSTKIEGDTPVFRRHIKIEKPGLEGTIRLLALPGNRTSATIDHQTWHFQIQSTNHSWPILSEEHQGEKAYAINVMVTPPNGDPFIRQLLAGYAQYTEDIIPGKGRAIKNIGRKLVDQDLSITLEYEPQTHFHLIESWALFIRRVGDPEWIERSIEGLPRYHHRIGSRDQVIIDSQDHITLRALDLEIPTAAGGDALSGASVHITGYLRYAHMKRQWRDNGNQLYPILSLSVLSNQSPEQTHELIAFDRAKNHTRDGVVQFVWLDSASKLNQLPKSSDPILHIKIPKTDLDMEIPITAESLKGPDDPFTTIEGTDFSYRIRNLHDNLVLGDPRGTVSLAMVDIKTPEKEFTRMVADQPQMSRDMHHDQADPHRMQDKQPQAIDPRITMTYQPAGAPIILAAYPDGLQMIYNNKNGRSIDKAVQIGEVVQVVQGVSLRVNTLYTHAVSEIKPYVVPPSSQQRDARESFAMIRLEVNTRLGLVSRWLSFNQYALPNESYTSNGRFAYLPEHFRMPDGNVVEVLFSRERRELPHAIALDSFELDTHVGGYSGSSSTIRNYISKLLFYDNGAWLDQSRSIAVNQPTEYGGYWYFQSTWDRPPNDNPSDGMNYTGLGVGNRNGVFIQLAGCCFMASGMIFTFYIKPIIKRRRAVHSRATAGTTPGQEIPTGVDVPKQETIQV